MEDVTQKWFGEATPYSHNVEEVYKFTQDGAKYVVDGKAVVFEPSQSERNIAELLRSNLGGEIMLMPRVNSPDNVKVSDYLFRGVRYDLKHITTPGPNVVKNRIGKSTAQTDNFIFDFTENPRTYSNLEQQVAKAFTVQSLRSMKTAIIVKDNEIKRIFRRA